MAAEVMVSVIMLTYNHEKYIRQALDSVLTQQTPFQYEVLIGDDASNDGTAQIIQEYVQNVPNQLRAVLRKDNLGATKNLSDLLTLAQGKYLAYLEGDDYWCDTTKLQRQVDFLEQHGAYVGCTHHCRLVDENGELCTRQRLPWIFQKSDYTIQDFKGLVLPGHFSTLMHRNIFRTDVNTWRPVIECDPLIGDRSLALLLASKGPIKKLPETMSCYRQQHGENATAALYTNNEDCIRNDYLYTKRLEQCARNLGIDGGFSVHYRDLFVSAVWRGVTGAAPDRFLLAKQILCQGSLWSYMVYLPFGAAKKFIQRIRRDRKT